MITKVKSGTYKLVETKKDTKILYLDKDVFAWVHPPSIGELLVASRATHKTDCVLSVGKYILFDVSDEPALSDQLHLELETGINSWQGYLLLSGLPTADKKRGRIIPTHETITNNVTKQEKHHDKTN